jgi:hypothetical protein
LVCVLLSSFILKNFCSPFSSMNKQ